jgi:ATP-binding cassette subfamily C (CFTR/MRP) protein 1
MVRIISQGVNLGLIATKSRALNKIQMKNKDNRTKMMDEVLSGMKVIKLYAWEKPFMERIVSIREQELATLKSIAYLQSASSFTWSVTPFLVAFVTFFTYSAISPDPLTSTKVFVSLSLFNLLSFPLAVFPSMITSAVEASVSFSRLIQFLTSEEQDEEAVSRPVVHADDETTTTNQVERVKISNASFSWVSGDDGDNLILKNINLTVKSGCLQAVVGSVGAGKSSLISAILGEVYKVKGQVTVYGSIAYVPQTAWITNSTVRENILFGKPYDGTFYQDTLEACGLSQDLEMLVAGDMTEIGERGINLSGGQKQRVSIARAVYARADIYLFDDALSAVDAHVGRHIFDRVLGPKGILKDKARLFVTHGIQYLPDIDQICMLAHGSVGECGSYADLMEKKGLVYSLVRDYGKKPTEAVEEVSVPAEETVIEKKDTEKAIVVGKKALPETAALMTKEESAKGSVDWKVYSSYAESCGIYSVVVFILIAIITQALSVSQNVLLSQWAAYNDRIAKTLQIFVKSDVFKWLLAYGALGVSSSLCLVFQVLYAWVFCGIQSARVLHTNLLENVLHLPQSFFDTTPLGICF